MSNMAISTQRLAVSGVEKQGKYLKHCLLVVSFLCGIATAFAKSIGFIKYQGRPIVPFGVSVQARSDVLDKDSRGITLPVMVINADQVVAHPLAFTGGGAEVILGSVCDSARRTVHDLATLVTGDSHYQVTRTPRGYSAGIPTELSPTSTRTYGDWLFAGQAKCRSGLRRSKRFINMLTALTGAVMFSAPAFKWISTTLTNLHKWLLSNNLSGAIVTQTD